MNARSRTAWSPNSDSRIVSTMSICLTLSVGIMTAALALSGTEPPIPLHVVVSALADDSLSAGHDRFVADGIVEQYLLDPRGDVEGLLLTDGTQMHVTSRAVTELVKAMKPGDHIRVEGRRRYVKELVSADVIHNVTTGASFSIPFRLDLPMLPLDRLAMTEMKAGGIIHVLLYSYLDGSVQGMALDDGTQVRLPPDVSEELRLSLKVGQQVSVEGYGTQNQYGRSLEALAMGIHGGPLTPLDRTLHHLP